MNGILDILIDIASTPALLVALIAILGNVLQKKIQRLLLKAELKRLLDSW